MTKKSTHRTEVVEVNLLPHPNADSLSIVKVWGYTVCVRTADWEGVTLGAYIVPDSMVDVTRPEFSFLRKKEGRDQERIRVKRLRNVLSQGFLCPAPEGSKLGDDISEQLGVTRYEPPVPLSSGGDAEIPPEGFRPKYDVDAFQRFMHVMDEGEEVIVTEKCHGSNSRFAWNDNRMWAGSRTQWRKPIEEGKAQNFWWKCLQNEPWIEEWCRSHPSYTLYGEVFGKGIQDLHYGKENISFLVFDIWNDDEGCWLQYDDVTKLLPPEHRVPLLFRGPLNKSTIMELAEGDSVIEGANHIREGCVVQPVIERYNDEVGRVKLKIVGNGYLERKGNQQ